MNPYREFLEENFKFNSDKVKLYDDDEVKTLKLTLVKYAISELLNNLTIEEFVLDVEERNNTLSEIRKVHYKALETVTKAVDIKDIHSLELAYNRINDNIQNDPSLSRITEIQEVEYIESFRRDFQAIIDFLNFFKY